MARTFAGTITIMHMLKASVFGSTVLLLTVAHAVEDNLKLVPQQAAVQAAEGKAQETVNLAISGMT